MIHLLPLWPADLARHMLVRRVQAVFHDKAGGEPPVVRSDNALYPPNAVIWRVHGDVTTMMIGGVSALLLQMLHPAALAGIWDHSSFRGDMLGRLRRTARFIALTTFGDRAEAQAAIARVARVHEQVRGVLPDGSPYVASNPRLLAWVHVCEAVSFLDAWVAFGDPAMTRSDQDRYFAQAALVARALGADPVPQTRAQADALIAAFRPELAVNERTKAVAQMILTQPVQSPAMRPVQGIMMQAAVDILPQWARAQHDLASSRATRPFVRSGAYGIAHMLRWAFRQEGPPRSKIMSENYGGRTRART